MESRMSLDLITKAANFCIVPWVHLYYFTDGYVYPCPSLAGNLEMRLGKTSDSSESLWNSKTSKSLRKKMLNNEFIDSCYNKCNGCLNSCKKYFGLDLLEEAKSCILSTKEDGSCDYNFIAWNLIESNLCNLKCQYCSFEYSNMWDENKTIHRGLPYEELLSLYEKNYDTVKEIWFASGEPILQESTYYFLNKLLKDNKTNVRIRLITNLMKYQYKNRNIYDLLAQFKDVIVFGSWDLNGERGEYIRTNSCSNTIKNTIKEINSKKIPFVLQSVMSIYNLYYYPKFHKELYDEGLVKKDNIRYYNLHGPFKYRYSILPVSIKNKIKDKLIEYKKWLGDNLDPFPNRECPLLVIDKIIDTLYTGKWGHWGFSEKENKNYYNLFLKENVMNVKNVKFNKLFEELIKLK